MTQKDLVGDWLEQHLRRLDWDADTPELTKTLVAGNIRHAIREFVRDGVLEQMQAKTPQEIEGFWDAAQQGVRPDAE